MCNHKYVNNYTKFYNSPDLSKVVREVGIVCIKCRKEVRIMSVVPTEGVDEKNNIDIL